ncbi:MAG: hypothetical protein ABIG44_16835 [Planctomycetota bacterium]
MLKRSLDEFEALFERASIPVLDIREIPLARIAVVLKGGPLDDSILSLAQYLRKRFTAEIQVHWPSGADPSVTLERARTIGLEPLAQPFASTAELVGQVSIQQRQLVIIPEPPGADRRVLDLDPLIQGTVPPVMLVRQPIAEPAAVFRRVLHSLTGNFRQTQNFAYSFSLVEDSGGELLLLHTIDEDDLLDVRDALRVSPRVSADGRAELLSCLTRRGERYLKAVVAASRKFPYSVSYRLAIGAVVPTVRAALESGRHSLLVVGCHREGHSLIEAADYELMHEVREIPVLAL